VSIRRYWHYSAIGIAKLNNEAGINAMSKLQSPDIRSLHVGGRCGSITVDPLTWWYLRMITIERGSSISALMTEIDRTRRLETTRHGMSLVRLDADERFNRC
jgi:predicted DNA-binding ribbon-helix-helix protein